MDYDAIVVGIGGMGSATAYHLARRGARVLGLEQFTIGHDRGSSHGASRIIRLAYWEHPDYVTLVRRAYELWQDLERTAGQSLLVVTGSVDAGPSSGQLFRGARTAARTHGLAHEDLSSAELTRRFPGFHLPPTSRALYQPDGGFLRPVQAIVAHVGAAAALGAEFHTGERVVTWTTAAGTTTVTTERGSYSCRRLVVTPGPWFPRFAADRIGMPVQVERQVVLWTRPLRPAMFAPPAFPVFYCEVAEGRFYGFPIDETGFKIGKYHHRYERVDPDLVDRVVSADDEAVIRSALARYFPEANGPTVRAETCLFTNTPDEHFVIGQLPGHPEVLIAGGFSGHGFKFCSVVGEILAELATTGATRYGIGLFRPERVEAGQ